MQIQPWWRRIPSRRRFLGLVLCMVIFSWGMLLAGNYYNEQIVPIEIAIDNAPVRRSRTADMPAEVPVTLKKMVDTPGLLAFAGQTRMNVLVLGVDYDYTNSDVAYSKNARSDSTMVVSLDNQGGFLNVVSIPRDCRVDIPGRWTDKINAAYAFGGEPLARDTVQQFLKAPVDHFVVVRVDGAARLVDALGGVDLTVEKNMNYDDNWGHLHVHLKKGFQHLNGAQAVGYCRFRHDIESDRGRMRRQQQVLAVLVGKLHTTDGLERLPELAKTVKSCVETDLLLPQLADLARLYAGFDRAKMKTVQIPARDAWIGDISCLIPDLDGKDEIVKTLLVDPLDLGLASVGVQELWNMSDNLARSVQNSLRDGGFQG